MNRQQGFLCGAEILDARVRFRWSDGFEAEFAAAWLLDNARTVDDAVGAQRMSSAQSLALAGPVRSVAVAGDAAQLTFANETLACSGPLLRSCAGSSSASGLERTLWTRASDIAGRPAIAYQAFLGDDAALESALCDVVRFGLVRLTGAGLALDETERAVSRFGFVRETNFGRLFEVRVVSNPDNLANTSRALEPHTDNPYRDPVPTLQVLHCIRDSGAGGETFFLDGFALAEWFREFHAEDFARLSRLAVPFGFAAADGQRYEARSPVIRLAIDGEVTGIRFNHRALRAVDFDAAQTADWYASYVKFANAAGDTSRQLSNRMAPGDIVIFDNERMLHGRNAFAGTADRLLTGCYADRDGLLATLARVRNRSAQ